MSGSKTTRPITMQDQMGEARTIEDREAALNYEVKLSPRGFDVRERVGEQAVYFSHSRFAAEKVCEALNAGYIHPREAVKLPAGPVADVLRLVVPELVE